MSTVTEAYPGELDMLRGLLGVVRVIALHSDIDELRRVVREYETDKQAARAEERKKSSRDTTAEATPEAERRLADLLSAVRAFGGRWKSGRAVLALHTLGHTTVSARTARFYLTVLAERGHLVQHDQKGVRWYSLARQGGAR